MGNNGCPITTVVRVRVLVVAVVLTLTCRYNVVRGHRTGSNYSGVEDYVRREKHKPKHVTQYLKNRIRQSNKRKWRSTYLRHEFITCAE